MTWSLAFFVIGFLAFIVIMYYFTSVRNTNKELKILLLGYTEIYYPTKILYNCPLCGEKVKLKISTDNEVIKYNNYGKYKYTYDGIEYDGVKMISRFNYQVVCPRCNIHSQVYYDLNQLLDDWNKPGINTEELIKKEENE